jgi:negative regulator of sigma E activity
MACIAAACIAVISAVSKANADKKAADEASAQAIATQQANQAAQIARAYGSSMRAMSDPSAMYDAARSGDTGVGGSGASAASY